MKTNLIEEAKQRGYKKGTIIYSLCNSSPELVSLDRDDDFSLKDNNELWGGGCLLYDNGTWAKILTKNI